MLLVEVVAVVAVVADVVVVVDIVVTGVCQHFAFLCRQFSFS